MMFVIRKVRNKGENSFFGLYGKLQLIINK